MSGQLVVDQVHGEAELGLVQQTVPVRVRQGPHLVHTTKIFLLNHENIFHLGEYGAGQAGLQHDGLDLGAGQLALLGAGSAEHGAPPAQICRYVDRQQ